MSSQVPTTAEIADMTPTELESVARRLDGERRRAEAALAMLVQRVDTANAFTSDGHRSVKAWGRATCNWSGGEAARFLKTGRMLARFESAATAASAGKFGVAQMHALGQLVGNQRVSEQLDASEELLVSQASLLDYDDYITLLAHWEALADADGAHSDHERAHRERRAHLSIVGERVYLDAAGGAAAGVGLQEVFEQFSRSEWLADWDAGVQRHGDEMAVHLMERTDAQRRFDALQAIFGAAAVSGQSPAGEPVVNVVVGYELFEHHLRRALGERPAPLDPTNPAHRCETADGVVIDPYDMLVAAALGQVRRIVLDSAGVVVDVGRKQRLFTGALRDAVMLVSHRCIWPGCYPPASQCEADHVLPFSHAGPTAASNGGPACGHHNRWKSRGYRTWRDPNGQWHHYRPDNTEIGWRAAA
ncbi:MAG: DUF222 domain-containing protein [Actinobacteria bacterium]|nr:DUF222 domain-containing protein [Actinomycetota bacterium]